VDRSVFLDEIIPILWDSTVLYLIVVHRMEGGTDNIKDSEKSELRSQTFMLHTRPNPICETEWAKLSPHWCCDDLTKNDFVGLFHWIPCV
jgi:hypothetical protein